MLLLFYFLVTQINLIYIPFHFFSAQRNIDICFTIPYLSIRISFFLWLCIMSDISLDKLLFFFGWIFILHTPAIFQLVPQNCFITNGKAVIGLAYFLQGFFSGIAVLGKKRVFVIKQCCQINASLSNFKSKKLPVFSCLKYFFREKF